MADEFNTTSSSNWWDSSSSSSSRNRFDSSGSSSSTTNNSTSFGWPRSSIDSSASVSGSSIATDNNLHMMALGLSSSPSLDWNQAILRGDKSEGSYRSMLQESLNSTSSCYQFSPHGGGGSSSDSTVTCQGLPLSFQMDSSGRTNNLYGDQYPSSSTIFQGGGILLGSDNNQNYNQYMNNNTSEILLPPWSAAAAADSKVPQFLRTSPPKQQQQQLQHTHLHFSNNAPFWNASAAAGSSVNDVGSSPNFFPSLQAPFAAAAAQSFDEKPKHHVPDDEVRETSSTATKKSNQPAASKRAKNDQTASPLPAFKVRKEKMGDRITALQQLVSPFGKTDTASVLSEAIEYIKFLHEQVAVLSTPYMKSGAPITHLQNPAEKAKDSEGPRQDLRSRGLCLVPVSSTFPVTHETTVDYWTPTFGGTFR